MSKLFKDLKPGDLVFLVGSPDFIINTNLEENFSSIKVKSVLETLDGKRNSIMCVSGELSSFPNTEKPNVAYFTALSDSEISESIVEVRIDSWSERFTRTISEYRKFLSFSNNTDGLDFLERKFSEYIKNIKELRNNEA